MIIKGNSGGNFTPAPEGLHAAVCVDVVDLGMKDSAFGPRHRLRVVWEIDTLIPDKIVRESKLPQGSKFTVRKEYTASLHEKSNLAKDITAWRGKPLGDDERQHFEMENLIGAPARVLVQHQTKDDTTYANVMALMKAEKKLAPSGTYKRVKDREPQAPVAAAQQTRGDADDSIGPDDIPFAHLPFNMFSDITPQECSRINVVGRMRFGRWEG